MANGYTRQSASQISSGQSITSAPVNNEFNQLVSAFATTGGHNHDGTTTGCGPQLGTSAISGMNSTSAGIIAATGSNATVVRTLTGTAGTITVTNGTGASANPTFTIDAAYVGQTSIITLGTITTGTWNGTVLTGTYGGTGINNGANTITLNGNISTAGALTTAGAFNTVGAYAITITATNTTSVTLPTSGTLVNTAVTSLASLTSAAALSTVGNITSGTWSAGAINTASNITTSGAISTSQDLTVNSNTIFINGKTTGVAAQLGILQFDQAANHGWFVAQNSNGSFSIFNQSSTTTAMNIVQASNLVTFSGNIYIAGTITNGAWNAGTISIPYGGTGLTSTGSSGNILLSNGSAWVSSSLATANIAVTNASNTFTGAQIASITSLSSSGGSVAINLANNNNFSLPMTESTTLANPSNMVAGQSGQIIVTQNASSAYTLAYGTKWVNTVSASAPAMSTTLSAVNIISYYVVDSTHIWYSLSTGGVT